MPYVSYGVHDWQYSSTFNEYAQPKEGMSKSKGRTCFASTSAQRRDRVGRDLGTHVRRGR
jgi:hypothetical protein